MMIEYFMHKYAHNRKLLALQRRGIAVFDGTDRPGHLSRSFESEHLNTSATSFPSLASSLERMLLGKNVGPDNGFIFLCVSP